MISKWRNGLLFPLILAIGLGGLSAWLGRISQVEIEETELNPNEPQYSMQGIDGRRFDTEGRLKENLSADSAWQMPKSEDIYLAEPRLTLYRGGKKLYDVNSQTAQYNLDNKIVWFKKDVVLRKAEQNGDPAAVLETASLKVDTQSETASTDAQVAYRYGLSHGTANGLEYNHRNGFLNLPSRVKAIIYDPKNH